MGDHYTMKHVSHDRLSFLYFMSQQETRRTNLENEMWEMKYAMLTHFASHF